MATEPAGRPTLEDVAAKAGVSTATVSRVVNGRSNVREPTRRRVESAMRALGYVAHASAQSLASGKTHALGLIAHDIVNPFFGAIIKGIDEEVAIAGFDLLICTTHGRKVKQAQSVARLAHGVTDGLLIILPTDLPEYVEQLRAGRFPFVLIDHDGDAPGCTIVNAANRAGTRDGIAYLIELGHRRVGFITGRLDVGAAHERLHGYRDALASAGIHEDEALIKRGDFQEDAAYVAASELLEMEDRPTAIFASSDSAAFGVLAAARDAGLTVPQDLSVMGFDDIEEASRGSVALTTVRQPLRDMGRLAVRQLLSLLSDPTQPPHRVVADTELVIRDTTSPPT